MQYKEGQRLQGSDGNVYVVQGGVPRLANGGPNVVVPAPQKPEPPKFIPGAPGYVLGPGNTAQPITGMPPAKTSYRTLTLDEKMQRGLDPAGDYQISTEGQITSIPSPRNQQNQLTSAERGKAVQAYTDAAALERVADKLERQFNQSIGKTKGVYGIKDVLPTPGNRRFTDTSHQARGLVKRALGFTGGEGNTIGEIELNYGPYLPEASNFDERIVGKIEALRQLAKDARTRSVAMLGGVPDVNGRVTPVQQPQQNSAQPPATGNLISQALDNSEEPDWPIGSVQGDWRRIDESTIVNEKTGEKSLYGGTLSGGQSFSLQDAEDIQRRIRETDTFGSGLVGAADAMTLGFADEAAAGINALGGALTGKGSLGDLYSGNVRQERAYQDALRERNPGASLAGSIGGSALGMTAFGGALRQSARTAPLANRAGGFGGDVLYGTGYGAGASNDDRLTGAVTGSLAAAAGNKIGSGIVNVTGKAVGGLTSPALRYLSDRGISLTPGQILGQGGILGKGYRAIEDTIESVPFLGASIKARKQEGVEAFNREAFKDALKPINQQVEGTIGQDAIGEAQDLVGDAYGTALGGVNLRPDGSFIRQTDDILRRGSAVPVMGEQFNYLMGQKIDPLFTPELSGRSLQAAMQTLNRAKGEFNKQGIMGNEVADATNEMRDAFIDMANRQAPGAMPALSAANAANRNVSILGDAVNRQGGELFTPAQLRAAAIANTKKFGGQKAAARNDTPFKDLYQHGERVLPNVVPNSGTTDRALATMVLPAALGGTAAGSEAIGLDPAITGTFAGLSLLSTKKGNQLFQKLLIERPEAAREIGRIILTAKRPAGMFGAGAALPALPAFNFGQ